MKPPSATKVARRNSVHAPETTIVSRG